jgi:single-strand DNA-binding protein
MCKKKERRSLMYNYVMLIGTLCTDIEIKDTKDGKQVTNLLLAVRRPFKNPKTDSFDTDFIPISIWNAMCDVAQTYLKKGSKVAVKGRIVTRKIEDGDKNYSVCEIVGEKLMFISSKEGD